jgi:signal-transduction protein with cAMP-binding, CBS, and nucleotidyltransferase domain
VADLARTDTLVSPDTLTDTVASLMEREPNRDAVVLGRHGVPSGIVTRQRLLSQLSQLYGNALYRRKPIQELADLQPLIVNGTLPPNDAALRATKRSTSTR